MDSCLIVIIINFLYYVYLLKGEVCAPVDRDKFTERLYEIWHLLTLVRPGYIFDKMADDRERIAVNILALACARIPPPLPLPLPYSTSLKNILVKKKIESHRSSECFRNSQIWQ